MSLENFARKHFILQIIQQKPERSIYESDIGHYLDKTMKKKSSLVVDSVFIEELSWYLQLSSTQYANNNTTAIQNHENSNNQDDIQDIDNTHLEQSTNAETEEFSHSLFASIQSENNKKEQDHEEKRIHDIVKKWFLWWSISTMTFLLIIYIVTEYFWPIIWLNLHNIVYAPSQSQRFSDESFTTIESVQWMLRENHLQQKLLLPFSYIINTSTSTMTWANWECRLQFVWNPINYANSYPLLAQVNNVKYRDIKSSALFDTLIQNIQNSSVDCVVNWEDRLPVLELSNPTVLYQIIYSWEDWYYMPTITFDAEPVIWTKNITISYPEKIIVHFLNQ